jgi:hypothetical protein
MKMTSVILDQLAFHLDPSEILRILRVREGSSQVEVVSRLVQEAESIAAPKAMYQIGYIEAKGPDYIEVGGFRFTSRVLRVNLDQAQRVFVYVCTAGRELEAWMRAQTDMLTQYYADLINEQVLRAAGVTLGTHWKQRYQLEGTSQMNPGSLPDWPLHEQRVLFEMLGDTRSAIGVELLGSLLMKPAKTVSGIVFPTQETFASCQLCPRQGCPNRRAPYDPELFEQKYRETAGREQA